MLETLLFVISSSSDNLIAGLNYGIRKVKINTFANFLISFISGIGTFLAMLLGKVLIQIITIKFSNMIGSGILIIFGLYLLLNWIKTDSVNKKDCSEGEESLLCRQEYNRYEKALRDPDIIDTNHSKTIEWKEAVILGMVLCVNNICLGIGASITGLNMYATSFFSFVSSLVFLPFGHYIGEKLFADKFSRTAELVAILIIIFLGVYELFT